MAHPESLARPHHRRHDLLGDLRGIELLPRHEADIAGLAVLAFPNLTEVAEDETPAAGPATRRIRSPSPAFPGIGAVRTRPRSGSMK